MPIPLGTETVATLAAKVKSRFPHLGKYDDTRVVQELIRRSAKYQKALSTEALQGLTEKGSIQLQKQRTEPAGTGETIKGIAMAIQ